MIVLAAYTVLCYLLAWLNAKYIREDKRIYHGLNGIFHLGCWIGGGFIRHNALLIACMTFIGRSAFDLVLNIKRGLPVGYVPQNPRSIVDKVEISIFGADGIVPKVIYFLIIVVLLTINYVTHG